MSGSGPARPQLIPRFFIGTQRSSGPLTTTAVPTPSTVPTTTNVGPTLHDYFDEYYHEQSDRMTLLKIYEEYLEMYKKYIFGLFTTHFFTNFNPASGKAS